MGRPKQPIDLVMLKNNTLVLTNKI